MITELEKSEDCCAITATLWSERGKQKKYCLGPLDTFEITLDTIASINAAGCEDVFDIQVDRTENFIANGLVSHNTRWHESDLAGRLLESSPDQWDVLNLPAEAEANDQLGRQPGEWLWTDDEYGYGASLAAIKAELEKAGATREWASQYQQRPRPADGSVFKTAMIEILPACPPLVVRGRGWDLAATKNIGTRDPDYTVGIGMGRTAEGKYVIFDCRRERGGPDEVKSLIRQTATLDSQSVRIGFPQDPGQAGKAQVLDYARLLAGHVIDSLPVTGDKATRAAPFASQVNVGNVAIVNAEWNRALLDELAAFPSGTHDDQVDAASEAFRLVGLGPTPIVFSPGQLRSLRSQAMGVRR